MYTLTQFDTIYDKDTTKVHTYENLEDFEKVFYNLSKRPGYKPKKGEFKEGSPLITPATFSTSISIIIKRETQVSYRTSTDW